ncbi:MAG TPA: DNA polymerase, partial [Bacteroidota bacterium]|nr:DNA polymerase [Bacteroidota bacterium]
MAATERLFLLDGMAIAYRAYFAFIQKPLTNAKGENTSAVYGFVTFLNRILSQEFPEHLAVVFDTAAPTFRHKAYQEYKATRQKMPDDMAAQLPILKEVVRAYNIPIVELDGYEADDIIGTLAKQADQEGALSFLVTPDKDFLQLVTKQTKIFKPGRMGTDVEIVDIEGVKKRFGVAPEHVIDVLALTGDSSDNVPGVPGIGEKTAIPLIQKYGTIENLYKHLDDIPQKGVRTKLEANKELAKLSKELVTICTTVPLNVNFHDLKAEKKDTAKLILLFEELNFRSLLERLKLESGVVNEITDEEIAFTPPEEFSDITKDQHTYTLITKEKDFNALCKLLASSDKFVYDTETTSIDALQAALVGISFALKPHEAWYVAIRQSMAETQATLFSEKPHFVSTEGIDITDAIAALKPIFENPTIKKIGHNIKYDMLVLSQYGVQVEGVSFDSMVASYVVRADGRHGMDDVAEEYLNYKPVSYEALTGTGKNQKDIREIPLADVSNYSCEDADITFRLYEHFEQELASLEMTKLCQEIEFPLVSVLAHMEQTGIAIDSKYLAEMSKDLERQIDILTRDIYEDAGSPFNINSTQQLSEVLFNKLKLPAARKTKTGFSTDIAVLESLQGTHPIIE